MTPSQVPHSRGTPRDVAGSHIGPALFLLGGIELRGGTTTEANQLLAQSKTVALLAYLTLAPPQRFQRRDRLVGLLWPELDQTHARAALRKAVHAVRTVIGREAFAARGDEELASVPEALWCDAAEFARAIEKSQLARALELYRDELMPGFHLPGCLEFDMWLDEQRAALRERAAAASLALAQGSEADARLTDAAAWARRAVRVAWYDERVLRRALTMLHRVGDRAGALQLYENFARRLRAEMEAEPSAETRALVATLRA